MVETGPLRTRASRPKSRELAVWVSCVRSAVPHPPAFFRLPAGHPCPPPACSLAAPCSEALCPVSAQVAAGPEPRAGCGVAPSRGQPVLAGRPPGMQAATDVLREDRQLAAGRCQGEPGKRERAWKRGEQEPRDEGKHGEGPGAVPPFLL